MLPSNLLVQSYLDETDLNWIENWMREKGGSWIALSQLLMLLVKNFG